jgi:L-malate glycosyltransferase
MNSTLQDARILLLADEISSITDGGTERQILQMVDICNQNRMQPQICVMRRTRWLTPQIAGCPVTHFQIETVTSARGIASLIQLTRWMRSQKFDILQTFFSEANLVGPCAGRLAGIPLILGTRRNLNHYRADDPHRLQLRAQRFVNLLVDQIIANSEAVRERIAKSEHVSLKRLSVVYNGIDLGQMKPAPQMRASMRHNLGIDDNHILVGNISGLRKIKGVQMFVDAAAQAYSTNSNLRFLLVGDGELMPELGESIRNYGLKQIIRLVGPAEDVRPYLAAFDVAVLCSQAEGFSNSLLEYMACGIPAIATDVGGNREALGSCGLLIRPETNELVRAIQSMSNRETRNNFASGALLRVKEFDVPIARERMGDLYSRFLNEKFAPTRLLRDSLSDTKLAQPFSEGTE